MQQTCSYVKLGVVVIDGDDNGDDYDDDEDSERPSSTDECYVTF